MNTNEDVLFLATSSGSVVFGEIKEYHHLLPANIYLGMGNDKEGYVHILKRHEEQILKAGFKSVIDFVEYVSKNFTTIKEGRTRNGEPNGTYLLQVESEHRDTLYISLSIDKKYWKVNSGGVFNRNYGRNFKTIWSASEVQKQNRHLLGFGELRNTPKKAQFQTVLSPKSLGKYNDIEEENNIVPYDLH